MGRYPIFMDERFNIVNTVILPKLTDSMQSLSKFQLPLQKLTRIFMKNSYGHTKDQFYQNHHEKEQSWIIHLSQFQNLIKSYRNQKSMVLTYKDMYQWNRIQSPEINPHVYGWLTCDKNAKTSQWRKTSLFNKHVLEQWDIHMQEDRVRLLSHTIYKNELKMD